jgi:hypothetical protein
MEYLLILLLFHPMTGETREANRETSEDEDNAGQRNYRFLDSGQTLICYPSSIMSTSAPPFCINPRSTPFLVPNAVMT